MPAAQARVPFDQDDEMLLMKFIATYCPTEKGRSGNALYKKLVNDADGRWPWAERHTWESWRDKYYKNKNRFDARIKTYQKKHGIAPPKDKKQGLRYSHVVELEQRIEKSNTEEALSQINGVPENKGPDTSQNSTQQRRTAARKTTAFANGTAPSRSAVVSESKITDAAVDLSSNSDESDSDYARESKAEKRKITSEAGGRENAKKRRTSERAVQYEEVSLEIPTSAGTLKAQETLKGGSAGNRPSPTVAPQSNDRSQSQLVKKIRESFGALDQLPEEQRAQLLRELRLSIVLRESSTKHVETVESDIARGGNGGQAPLYPDLSKDLDRWDVRAASLDIEGKSSKSPPEQPFTKQGSREQFSSSSTIHVPNASDMTTTNGVEAGLTIQNKTATPKSTRKIMSKRNDDDFFGTPEPPSPKGLADTVPTTLASTIPSLQLNPNGTSDHGIFVAESPVDANGKSPHLSIGVHNNDHSGINGQQSVSKNGVSRPVPTSDSDTSEIESNGKQSKLAGWPPRRRRSNVKRHGTQGSIAEFSTSRNERSKDSPKGSVVALEKQVTTTSNQSPAKSLQHSDHPIASVHANQALSPSNAAAGPSRIVPKPSALARVTEARSSYKTPTPDDIIPSVPSTSASDPFITADHVRRLRLREKGKARGIVRDDAKTNRRLTFGGFSAKQGLLPEVDLRKKDRERNRYSLDWNSLSEKAVSPSRRESMRRQEASASVRTRRTSFATTIDLAEDIPSPAHGISPADQALINRAGLQFFIQAMAQHHEVSEKWVLRVYEECRGLPETDRVLGEIRGAAERAFEKAIERDNKDKQSPTTVGLPSRAALADELLRDMDMAGEDTNGATSSVPLRGGKHEAALDGDGAASQPNIPAGQRLAELHFTPTDPRVEYKRALGRYAPPSSSRAARYVQRARQSSGMGSSPLKPTPESSRAKMAEMIDLHLSDSDDKADEKEVENSPALTRPQALEDASTSLSADAISGKDSLPASRLSAGDNEDPNSDENVAAKSAIDFPWSLEEDAILERGEDEEAMQVIIERRGKGAVRRRLVELMSNDTDLFA